MTNKWHSVFLLLASKLGGVNLEQLQPPCHLERRLCQRTKPTKEGELRLGRDYLGPNDTIQLLDQAISEGKLAMDLSVKKS